ncbi:heme o synthase [Georgenia halophila]|uniref:Protoheme IX farnesyltransferase n=1 Tax=Georgenia halophila TaxID=620889 RepID=A0ABP8L875_9MICO
MPTAQPAATPDSEPVAGAGKRAEQNAGPSAARHDGAARAPSSAPPRRSRLRAYLALTKPRIIELLLVTTIPTMILAAQGWPGTMLLLATLVGGSFAAGSANAFNMYLDRDIDRVMNRTKQRPLVTGELSERQALVFAATLGAVSIAWFAVLVNAASAWLTLAAILLYVVLYTMVLKRRTSQNIVWGGVAGCMPVLIGWSAVTGSVGLPPLLLFLVVFFWTPPHYWPLSMKFKSDYARAGVPMLPVVADDLRVARQILFYAALMVACSLALLPLSDLGWVYGAIAAAAGVWFLVSCALLYRRARHPERGKLAAMKVFHGSITYLTVVFLAVAVDPLLPL